MGRWRVRRGGYSQRPMMTHFAGVVSVWVVCAGLGGGPSAQWTRSVGTRKPPHWPIGSSWMPRPDPPAKHAGWRPIGQVGHQLQTESSAQRARAACVAHFRAPCGRRGLSHPRFCCSATRSSTHRRASSNPNR